MHRDVPGDPFLVTTVSEAEDGMHLVAWAARNFDLSRKDAKQYVASGQVQIGARISRILMRRLRAGERLRFRRPVAKSHDEANVQQSHKKSSRSLAPEVLHLDRWLIVINKPTGLLSEPDRFGAPSLMSVLPPLLMARGEPGRLWLVHRLDAGTSGVMVLARSKSMATKLSQAFRQREVIKHYRALVKGHLVEKKRVCWPIARVLGTRHGVDFKGQPAQTYVSPKFLCPDATWVGLRPTTGRTHQIRVHLAALGHPILGDTLYRGPRYVGDRLQTAVPHLMLHARILTFVHPKSLMRMTFVAPLPQSMQSLMHAMAPFEKVAHI